MGLFDNLDPVAGLDETTDQGIFGDIKGPGEVSKGLKRGALRLGAEVARGAEAVAKGTGFGAVKSRAGEIATDLNAQAADLAPRVGSYTDVNSLGTAADYAAGLLAENAVQLPLTALAAFLGAKGGARLMGERALASMVGGAAGAFVPSYVQNFGDVYNEQREAGLDDPLTAAKYSVPIAALDALGPGLLAGILLKPEKAAVKAGAKTLLDKIMKGVVLGSAEEAPTEALQEDLAIRARAAIDPNFDPSSSENIQRRREAAVGGGVVGGVVGGGGGAISAITTPVAPAAVPSAVSEEPAAPAAPGTEPAAPQAPAQSTVRALDESVPLPVLNTPEEILPLINANAPDALEESFIAARRAEADAEFAANPERVTAQFLNGAVSVAEARISALDAELALPAKQRSRPKQAITKEKIALTSQLEPMRKRASALSVLADTPQYQEKSPLVEGTLINVQQPTEAPNAAIQGIIQQGSVAEHLERNARGQAAETGDRDRNVSGGPIEETNQAVETNEAGEQVPTRRNSEQVFSEQLARINQEQGRLLTAEQAKFLRRQSAAPDVATPKLAVVTARSRENLKFAPTDVRAESFMNESARVVEANVTELVANGMVKETSAQSVRNVINEGIRTGLATQDVEKAKSFIENGVRRALKGKVAKVDVEPIVDKIMTGIATQENRFVPFSTGGPLRSELRPTLAGLPERAEQAPLFADIPASPSPTTAIQFEHFGNVPGGVTDPTKIGSGVLGRDQAIAREYGLNYTSAVVRGAEYREPEVQAKTKYTGTLDASKVHLASEGDPLFQQAKADIAAQGIFNDSLVWMDYAKKVRDAGFDAIMYAGGQLRIFTPQRVSPEFNLAKAQKRSSAILKQHAESGGGSWNLMTGDEMGGTSNYAVSPYKGREVVIPGQPTEDQIAAYIATNQDLLSNPVNVLGTWFNSEDGNTYLDVSILTPSFKEAQRIALKAKQLAFFNLRTFEEVKTDTAEPVELELFRNVQSFTNLDTMQRLKGQQAIDYLEFILGTPSRLEVRPFAQSDPNGHTGVFRGGHMKDVIEMAMNSKDVLSVAAHEGFHFVETRVLSGNERVVLRRAFDKESRLFKQLTDATRRYDQENGTDITNEIELIPAEAHAYGFEFWKRGELQADGALAAVFRKIAELFARIKNFIDGFGFQTAEDIFTAIDRGQYARRENQAMRIDSPEGESWFDDIEKDAIPGLQRAGDKAAPAASAAKGRPYWVKDGHDVAKMRRRIKALALEGETARSWHRESGEEMLKLYGGDMKKAEILAKLVAVFSPRTQVGTDLGFAFKAIDQFNRGQPVHAGVFPTEMSKKATAILSGTEDQKLVTGIKRNTFYRNLMNAIDPVNHNTESQGATIDMWMAHAFGFNHDVAGRINQSEYRYAEAEVGRLARDLGWTIEETQAAIWTAMKARFNQVRADAKKWGIRKGLFESVEGNERQAGLFVQAGGAASKLKSDEASHRKYLENWTKLALSVPLDPVEYEKARYNYGIAIREYVRDGKIPAHAAVDMSDEPIDGDIVRSDVEPDQGTLRFYSRAALADLITEAKRGEAQLTQMHSVLGKIIDSAEIPEDMQRAVLGNTIKGYAHGTTSSFKTFYDENVSSGLALSRKSAGYKNVFDVLTSYNQRKDRLIVDSVDGKLSEWRKGATAANFENTTRALLERTVNAYALDSADMQRIITKLDAKERAMFKQATDMIADRLNAEFEADKRTFSKLLGLDSKQYAEWEGARAIQVAQLINDGYFPERRYGDHGVHTYIEVDGKRLTLNYELNEHRGEAERRIAALNAVLKDFPDIKTEYTFKYKAEYDGSVSFQQFLDMARRNGIELTQAERERLAKSMIASDSVRRNRIFRRKNIPGFSEDGERILAEFGVTMANKIAYSEFGAAIQDSLKGTVVQSKFGVDGQPEINTYEGTNAWREDGELSGFYRNLADNTTDFVTSPNPGNKISSTLRAAATLQFLGGSLSAGAVQLSSLAMNTTPYLSAFTGYTNALSKTFSALKVAATNHVALTDINTLQDLSHAIPDVDSVPGLRAALTVAVQDGTTLDTEIYQIMGLTRARTLSMSRGVRKAAEVWMAPFRITEQWNRISTFIAAYKIGQENNLAGDKLYKFAQQAVALTQGRYDEANRPALARGPVGALLFTFKAYPLFMLETMIHLSKTNPKAAVIMLLSLTAVAGVEGMPFAEDIEDIIDTIAQRVFGSPFNSKRAMRNMFKSASETVVGVDLSGVMMHGFANQLTGLNFASRVGLGNILPGTRIGAADADYKKVMSEVLGPGGSIATGWLNGIDALSRGEFVEAMKTGGPLAAQNLIKGVQSFQDGYASDIGGRKIVPASSWESFSQTLGFSSSALSNAYEIDRIDKAQSAFYKEAQKEITNDIIRGVRDGNADRVKEAVEFIGAWNRANPEMPMAISGSSLRRTIALNGLPLNQRNLLLLPRALRGGSESLNQLYGTDR